jgi:hypothetical protein
VATSAAELGRAFAAVVGLAVEELERSDARLGAMLAGLVHDGQADDV